MLQTSGPQPFQMESPVLAETWSVVGAGGGAQASFTQSPLLSSCCGAGAGGLMEGQRPEAELSGKLPSRSDSQQARDHHRSAEQWVRTLALDLSRHPQFRETIFWEDCLKDMLFFLSLGFPCYLRSIPKSNHMCGHWQTETHQFASQWNCFTDQITPGAVCCVYCQKASSQFMAP